MTLQIDSLCSRAALDEPLMGTIKTPARIWLLIEYEGPWRKRAIEDNDLPQGVQTWLRAMLAAHADMKALFVKQAHSEGPIRITVVETDTARMWRLPLTTYEELTTVDIKTLLQDDPEDKRLTGPLMVVCTNGKRDACCAKFGLATYNTLQAAAPFEVWQSTHITGHRYAATGIAFPHGIYYGRMDGAADAIMQAATSGEIALTHYRGRAHYPRTAQIAEALLRDHLDLTAVDALTLDDATTDFTLDSWQATITEKNGACHRVTIQREQVGTQVASACSTPEDKPVYRYTLHHIDTLRTR